MIIILNATKLLPLSFRELLPSIGGGGRVMERGGGERRKRGLECRSTRLQSRRRSDAARAATTASAAEAADASTPLPLLSLLLGFARQMSPGIRDVHPASLSPLTRRRHITLSQEFYVFLIFSPTSPLPFVTLTREASRSDVGVGGGATRSRYSHEFANIRKTCSGSKMLSWHRLK